MNFDPHIRVKLDISDVHHQISSTQLRSIVSVHLENCYLGDIVMKINDECVISFLQLNSVLMENEQKAKQRLLIE